MSVLFDPLMDESTVADCEIFSNVVLLTKVLKDDVVLSNERPKLFGTACDSRIGISLLSEACS